MCQIPDELLPYSKCPKNQESAFRSTAVAEFKSKLDETSIELRQLISGYLYEFRALSLGLVLVARNDTLTRLRNQQVDQNEFKLKHEATRRLFESMYSNLLSYQQMGAIGHEFELVSSFQRYQQQQQQRAPGLAGVQQQHGADIGHEIATYFRRLYLIHLKRLLEQRLAAGQWGEPRELDFECLENNLASQQKVELVLAELAVGAGSEPGGEQQQQAAGRLNGLQLEQARLSVSMRQSLEFARTLLSSLGLASEMFANLTRRVDDWMPSQACHSALTRMTVCQQCYSPAAGQAAAPLARQQYEGPLAPCENYCLNVARGCMNDLYELNRFWAEHVAALARFKSNMIQTNNIENVMSSLDAKLVAFMGRLGHQLGAGNASAAAAAAEAQVGRMPLALEVSNL